MPQGNNPNMNMDTIKSLAASPAGQQLIKMIRDSNDPGLQKAVNQVQSGNFDAAQSAIRQFLQSKEAQKLLKQLGG